MDGNKTNLEDWEINCSDDEKYEISTKWKMVGGMELPQADDIASLHEVLCVDRVLALEWRCIGRRPPTPEGGVQQQQEPISAPTILESKSDDFDFDIDDLPSSQPKLPVRRREGELKGGARKKTTSFNGVINNMKRVWKLDNEQPASSNPPPT